MALLVPRPFSDPLWPGAQKLYDAAVSIELRRLYPNPFCYLYFYAAPWRGSNVVKVLIPVGKSLIDPEVVEGDARGDERATALPFAL